MEYGGMGQLDIPPVASVTVIPDSGCNAAQHLQQGLFLHFQNRKRLAQKDPGRACNNLPERKTGTHTGVRIVTFGRSDEVHINWRLPVT